MRRGTPAGLAHVLGRVSSRGAAPTGYAAAHRPEAVQESPLACAGETQQGSLDRQPEGAVAGLGGAADAQRRACEVHVIDLAQPVPEFRGIEVALEGSHASLDPDAPTRLLQTLAMQSGQGVFTAIDASPRQVELPLPLDDQDLTAAPDHRVNTRPFDVPPARQRGFPRTGASAYAAPGRPARPCLSPRRSSRFITVETCQRPPRRVSIPQRQLVRDRPQAGCAAESGCPRLPARGHSRAGSALRPIAARSGAPPFPA